MSDYILSTERLGLRRWLDSDIKPFAELNSDREVMKYFPNILTHSETVSMTERIRQHFDEKGFGLFAVEHIETKQFIGFTGFSIPKFDSFFTPCVEIGWRYKKEYWQQGLATEAATACLKYGFNTLGFDTIMSFTAAINEPSQKLMRRIGMDYTTDFSHPLIEKGHMLCQHVLYQLNRENFNHPQIKPRKITSRTSE